jgi:hypothetical protein
MRAGRAVRIHSRVARCFHRQHPRRRSLCSASVMRLLSSLGHTTGLVSDRLNEDMGEGERGWRVWEPIPAPRPLPIRLYHAALALSTGISGHARAEGRLRWGRGSGRNRLARPTSSGNVVGCGNGSAQLSQTYINLRRGNGLAVSIAGGTPAIIHSALQWFKARSLFSAKSIDKRCVV